MNKEEKKWLSEKDEAIESINQHASILIEKEIFNFMFYYLATKPVICDEEHLRRVIHDWMLLTKKEK